MSLTEPTGLVPWRAKLVDVLSQHGPIRTPAEFMSVVSEISTSHDALTSGEQTFLTEHLGMADADFAPAVVRQAQVDLTVAQITADQNAQAEALTTNQVAELLDVAPANVRRLVGQHRLYTVGTARNGAHLFPRWQFLNGHALPGIAEILAALPSGFHPLDVAAFMTTSLEALGERTPAEWLASGGDVAAVATLAEDFAWE